MGSLGQAPILAGPCLRKLRTATGPRDACTVLLLLQTNRTNFSRTHIRVFLALRLSNNSLINRAQKQFSQVAGTCCITKMAHNASTPNSKRNQSSNPPQTTINMQHLSRSAAVDLLQIAIARYPDFAPLVSQVVSEADECARIESLKPPPTVNYMSLRSEFHNILHSLDRLRASQQFQQVWRLSSQLEPLVEEVRESVNRNSPRETVEEAFICLQKFASQIGHAEGEIYKGVAHHDGSVLDLISENMVAVGTLLKEKGGPKDQELKGKIQFWADGGEWGSEEFSFPEVLKIVWGTDEESEGDDEELDEDDEEEKAEDSVPHGMKRSFAMMDGNK